MKIRLLIHILVATSLFSCGEKTTVENDEPIAVSQSPAIPALPIRLPDGARLLDEFNPVPGTPSFHIQLRVPGGADEAAEFFRSEIARLGMKELEMPNPRQAKGIVVRLAGESKKARVTIMLVKHPIEKGTDADIRWEEPPI